MAEEITKKVKVDPSQYMVDIKTDKAPAAIGPYVQGKILRPGASLFYSSGVIPLIPETMQIVSDDITEQAQQVFKNLAGILEAAGTDFQYVLKSMIFLDDMDNFAKFNEVYSQYFKGDSLPARSCVAVKTLPKNVKVEVEVIAVVPN